MTDISHRLATTFWDRRASFLHRELSTLVKDALEGHCGIHPTGTQVRKSVWIEPSARVDPSVQIDAPCYIGAASNIKAGVTIRGCSSVERNCEIDLGTILDHASVLPNTYWHLVCTFRESVVDGTKLEHLGRGVSLDLGTAGLSARHRQAKPIRYGRSMRVADVRRTGAPGR